MKFLKISGALLALVFAGSASSQESIMKELSSTGKLRVALVFAVGGLREQRVLRCERRRQLRGGSARGKPGVGGEGRSE